MVQQSEKQDEEIMQEAFKYIQCYGSTEISHVTGATNRAFKYIQCYGSTQMCLPYQGTVLIFKYIQCYGSTLRFIFIISVNVII